MFLAISLAIDEEKDYLSNLDGAIGDADHGITMSIGFRAVNTALSSLPVDEIAPSEIMAGAANAFLNAVGASTGPLYATAFRRAGRTLLAHESLDLPAYAAMLEAIVTGIQERGKSQRGDKTMLDAWLPASEAARTAEAAHKPPHEFWQDVIMAAQAGAERTRSMIALKGRASHLGERSLGHVDPGAASAVVIIRAMAQALQAS